MPFRDPRSRLRLRPTAFPVRRIASPSAASLLLASLLGCGSAIQSVVSSTPTTPSAPPAAVRTGPQLGYIWSDVAHTLRPVLGIPGATQLGQSVVAANVYITAAASNLSSLALLQESDGALDLLTLPSGQPTRLAASVPPGAHLRFAPSGLTTIAFLPGANTVTLLTNLLTTPQITTVTLPQPIAEAVVSDAGSIAAALPSNGVTAIRTVSASGVSNIAATVTTLGGLSFAGTGENLLVADANTLTLIQASTSSPAPILLPTAGLLKNPLGLGISHDGHFAILASAADQSVVRVDLTAQTAPQRFPCLCQPALVLPLSGTGVFRITSADSGPAWIFDAAATLPRILFIPASASAATAQKAGLN